MKEGLCKAYLMFDGSAICPHCGNVIETGFECEEWYALPSGGFEYILGCPECDHEFRASREYEQETPPDKITETTSVDEVLYPYRKWFLH